MRRCTVVHRIAKQTKKKTTNKSSKNKNDNVHFELYEKANEIVQCEDI